ncbi:MAG: hypothetical protein JXM79_22915 [Sedimentisphaerales bacterium]|nr:hypothetical protein [Sedimentisphaerales bacterium]
MKLWIDNNKALRHIDAIGVVICLAASLAVYFFVLNPLVKQRSFLAEKRDEFTVQRGESSRLSSLMLSLGNQLTAAQEDLSNNKIRLESSDRTNQRLAALTVLFTECSLAVDDIQAGKISAGPMWDLVPITLTGRGHYSHCIVFLQKLRQTFADMSMDRLRLESNPVTSEEPGRFRFELLWHTTPEARTARDP